MNKKFRVLITIAIAVLLASAFSVAFTGNAFAIQQIMYDGYLQMTVQPPLVKSVLADTLIVVSNPSPAGTLPVPCLISVYDKYGDTIVQDAPLYNGGTQIGAIPANGFGWVTLSLLVNRTTKNPWGIDGGEKFVYRIKFGSKYPAIVEIKQVIYDTPQGHEAIWNAANIKSWTETSLGGLRANGLISLPPITWP
ncbi:MAG: hypothetical protein ABIB41_02930 [Nitrospirota bacterium]